MNELIVGILRTLIASSVMVLIIISMPADLDALSSVVQFLVGLGAGTIGWLVALKALPPV